MSREASLKVSIRPMGVFDLEVVGKIENETFPHPWPSRSLRYELVENEYCRAFVIERGRTVAGYAFLWVIFEQAHLVNIAVDESFRGQGLGEALLLHVLNYASKNGAELVHLEVRVTNEPAISLYRKYGFREIGVSKKFYSDGADALLMVMELPPGRRRSDRKGV